MALRPDATRMAAGWACMGLGVLGCVLPFLQGFVFLGLGLFLLRDQHRWAARGWGKVAHRWPGAVSHVERLEQGMATRLHGWGLRARRLLGRA